MNVAVTAGQSVTVRWVNPTFATDPSTSGGYQVTVWIEY